MNVPDPCPSSTVCWPLTAQVLDLTLVTRNVADVADAGVQLLNPFG